MDTHTDYFHHLPDEVIQLIFSRVTDCKTLIQCMSVSKAFRQHAVRVPSLSIVCPGNFSTYDERLLKIYTMVKAFRNLQSLIVRVGQPKEEPPSWARCMRYAEIGGSVEKFMFMAAKCGDFSELDATLLGLADVGDESEGKAWNGSDFATPLEAVVHTDMDRQDLVETSNSSISMGEVDDRNTEAWSDVESDEEAGQRGLLKTTNLSNFAMSDEQKPQEKRSQYSGSTAFDASFLLERGQRKPLSQFSLRQVIAPSNDVLKRMLPVIHFAIVQGLNELRDSLPGFVAMFAKLRSFLLVDMAESITVFMREHHIQELKSLYLQDWDGETSQVKETSKVEPLFSGLGLGRGEDKAKCSSGKMKEEEPAVAGKVNQGHSEVLDSRRINCMEDVVDSNQQSSNDKQVDDTHVTTQMPEDEVEENQALTVWMNEGCRPRSRIGGSSNRVLSACKLPSLQSISRKALEAHKGKEKLIEYQGLNLQEHGRPSASSLLLMDSDCKDFNTSSGIKDPIHDSLGGCSSLLSCQATVDRGDLNTDRLAGLKDGCSDAESLYQGIVPAYPTAGEALIKPCTRLGPLNSLDASVSCVNEHEWSSESDTELGGDGEMSHERGANKQAHLSSLEGLSGKLDCQHGKTREKGYRLQGLRCSRDSKVDWTNKHLLKRCHRSDGMKKTEFCRSLQYSAGLRMFDGQLSGDSAEDVDVERYQKPVSQAGLDKNKDVKKERAASAGDAHDDSLVASCSSGVGCTKNRVVCGTHVSPDGDDSNNREAMGNSALESSASDELVRDPQIMSWESHENAGHRLVDADAWRHVWQERVRRLRDTLRMAPGQEPERIRDDVRGRSRDRLRRHQTMEKDALSFDYTFWRAEQVSSCDYVMSDISMCIATHAAQTLGDAEKEVLLQAAIAGPLLVATVLHVNKHYDCHNL